MFQFTSKAKTLAYILILVGLVSWVAGYFMNNQSHEADGDHHTEQVAAHDGHEQAVDDHAHGHDAEAGEHDAHSDGVNHEAQQHNRPWAALLVNSFFWMAIGLGALFFLAIQYAAQAGWALGLTRVMEAVALFMPFPLIIIIVLVVLGQFHVHHLWHWMDPELYIVDGPHYDPIIAGKQGFLNIGFFLARATIYLVG
jgi:ABC-type nickel/cobalt efflux system permease component RcnA